MKKAVSLLLAILMVMTMLPLSAISSFAVTTEIEGATSKENAQLISYDTEYGITLSSSGTQWFKFTTKSNESYWYNITVKNISVGNNNGFQGVSGEIYDLFGECIVSASAFSNATSLDGAKLESSTIYYIAIYGCRAGKIKFQLNAEEDEYSETITQATEIKIGNNYESSIDSCGELTDDRTEDGINADVDYVKFNTGECNIIKFTLCNSDVDYYNTYFEGVAGKIVDSFGSTYCYLEVRPDSEEETIVTLEKNTIYYIKFFSTSGGMGKYKFLIEYNHTVSDWIIDLAPTCTASGIRYNECTVCKAVVETETISALGHDYDEEYTIDKEATYTEAGSKSRHCSRCEAITGKVSIPKLVRNGWVHDGTGWQYFENDTKVTNTWKCDSKGWCYLGADGYCVTNCWKKDSKGWCYLDTNGRMVYNNWVYDGDKWYFIDANGYMVANTWKKDSNGWCYLGSNGAMLTNAWVKDSVGWCYVGANGYCVTNKWVKDSHGWCYLDANGRMATNQWIKDSVGWCYVGADGYCLTNSWVKDSKGWCYLDANGRMVYNNWVKYNGQWYYLDANGYMVTGTKVIGGKTYKFNSSGVWIG